MKRALLFLLFLLITQLSPAQETSSITELKADIDSLLDTTEGNFAVAFKNISSGEELLINERREFHAASTMKTPVMLELFRRAELGEFSLEDSLLVKNSFRSIVSGAPFSLDINQDSGDTLYSQLGSRVSIRDLMVDMIINSSNLATNLLIELVDARKVTATMRKLGAQDIMVLRGVEDIEAYEAGLSNTTTAYDLLLLFEKLAEGNYISEAANEEMLAILLQQQFNDIIPALLPEGTQVAHKTGSITGVQHDSGLVLLPDGRKYVLVLLSDELEDPKQGVATLAKLSRLIYDHVTGEEQ